MRLALLLALASGPALADDPDVEGKRLAIESYQARDQALQDIGWKLARGNAEFCIDTTASTGLRLHDVNAYGEPDVVRAALGLTRDFAVDTIPADSPAATDPALRRNREVALIGDVDPSAIPSSGRNDYNRSEKVADLLDSLSARGAPVAVTFAGGQQATLSAVPICTSRFEIISGDVELAADGRRVVVEADFEGFDMAEDRFAAAIAHELAHNILGHPAWLDAAGRTKRNIRQTELEADRLMPWLLANAGYDPSAAARFIEAYRPRSGSVLIFRGTHPKWKDRRDAVNAEIALIAPLLQVGWKADWSQRFVRRASASGND